MSVAGIASSLFDYATQSLQTHRQQFRQEFLQLGQDLQSGNLAAAQSDFADLQQLKPASTNPNSPITQAFQQLSTDLQSGNISAAQQDYSTIQQSFQNRAHHAHHHPHGTGDDNINQLIDQLGQALQSGNLSAAQQAYTTLQQDFLHFAQNNGAASSNTVSNLSATA